MKRYNVYQDSGIDWIGEIPENWVLKELKYCVKCNENSLREDTQAEYPIEYIDISSVDSDGRINEVQKLLFKDSPSRARRIVKQGNVLVSTVRTYLKAIAQIKQPCQDNVIASTGFAVLGVKENLDSDFLYYYSRSEKFVDAICASSRGVSYPSITSTELLNLKICLPSLEEQTQIARYLDHKTSQIDKLITDKEKLIELLNEERTAIINQAVTKGLNPDVPMKDSGIVWLGEVPEHWLVCKMKHACSLIKDGTHGSFSRVEDGFRLLSVRNIINDEFVYREDDSRVSAKDYQIISSSFIIKTGDIQLAIVGATLGKVAIIKKITDPFVTQRSLATLRANQSNLLPQFLYFFVRSSTYQSFLWSNVGFSAQPGIYLGTLQNSFICLPDIDTQYKIVQYIDSQILAINELKFKVQQEIQLLKEYKTALISEVVTGKVDVRDEVTAESTELVS